LTFERIKIAIEIKQHNFKYLKIQTLQLFMPIIVKKSRSFKLAEMKQWGRQRFQINEEYQRSKMWSEGKKQLLLDSIIKSLPIGTFILKKKDDNTFEVLDGQQRIDAIFCFIEGHLVTPSTTKGFQEKNYADLLADTRQCALFNDFDIYYDEIEDGEDQEIAEIFLRLQEGVPLNSAEKLNATIGKMRDFVFGVSRHAVFTKGIKIGAFRFAHRLIAAQITLLEYESDFNHDPFPEFPNLRFPDLRDMYEHNRFSFPPGLQNRVYGTLDTIFQTLGENARVIRKKSDLPLVYLLTAYLRRKYVLDYRLLKIFLINFFTTLSQISIPEGEVATTPYEKYVELRKKGLTHDSFSERFRILVGLFLNQAPSIVLKDPKRSFEVGQKLAIFYNKNDRVCQYCQKEVKWEEADFHHIVYHSKGGPTTVENGQLMHLTCHREFHKKDEKNAE
jgi:hypothetical protein